MGIGIKIAIEATRYGGLDPAAAAWQNNIIANGGTISAATLKIFNDNFFVPARANGNILTELDRLNVYAGLVGFEIAARTNMIKNAHYVTPVSSPSFNNNGYVTSGTSYLNLNYKLFSQGVKLQKNNNSFGVMVLSPAFSVDFLRMIGSRDAGGTSLSGLIRGNVTLLNANATTSYSTISASAQSGWALIASQRVNSSSFKSIINASETTLNVSSSASNLNDLDTFELTINGGGSPDGQYDTRPHGASFHGSSNLDIQALRTLLLNTFGALGV